MTRRKQKPKIKASRETLKEELAKKEQELGYIAYHDTKNHERLVREINELTTEIARRR